MSDIALPITGVPGLARGERMLGDERLAKLAAGGSARAFAALYGRHHQAIYRYCRSILRHDQDAQDALQSTMMRAYAALRSQERDLAVRPWLFRIAHNEAISLMRKRRSESELSDDHEQPGGEVEHVVEVRQRLGALVADLQALPERQRAALLMRELSGLSIEEIAAALAISQGAAKQTLFEARSSLHELSEGRAMPCEAVREAISLQDGRVLRGRRIRAHLRACEECRSFRAGIGERSADLRALAPPLPAVTASTMLAHLLAHGGGHSGGAAVSGASLGGHAAASLVAKSVAGVAIVAATTAGAIHLTTARHHRDGGAARHSNVTRVGAGTSAGVGESAPTGGSKATAAASASSEPHSSLNAHPGPSAGKGGGVSIGGGAQAQAPALVGGSHASESAGSHARGAGGSTNTAGRHDGKGTPQPKATSHRTAGGHPHHSAKARRPAGHKPQHAARHSSPHAKPVKPRAKAPVQSEGAQAPSGQETAGGRQAGKAGEPHAPAASALAPR